MRLPTFTYDQPTSVTDAIGSLAATPGARPIAGGTDLLVNMKHRVETPPALVSLSRVEGLSGVTEEDGTTVIGALTTLKQIQNDPELQRKFPALTQAASAVGSYRHQTMGTLAGNLCQNTRCRFFNQSWEWRQARSLCYKAGGQRCHVMNKDEVCYSTYSGDVAPALLVLDASVRIQGPGGAREIPLADLHSGDGRQPLALNEGEVVTAVTIPAASANGRSHYEKSALRGSIDFPIVGGAVWRGDNEIRVAFTAVDRRPVRATAVEETLAGKELTEETIAAAAPLAAKAGRIAKTTVHGVPYKRDLMSALFTRGARALL